MNFYTSPREIADGFWQCACGSWNVHGDTWCYQCFHTKGDKADGEAVLKIIDIERTIRRKPPAGSNETTEVNEDDTRTKGSIRDRRGGMPHG